MLENLVFITLRRLTSSIYYYKTEHQREIDFIVKLENQNYVLIQVCESLQQPKTREREINALNEAMTELHLKHGIIVTRNEEEKIETPSGYIYVTPIWKFLINPLS